MRFPLRRRLSRGLAWVRSRGRPRALILGYHRVGTAGADPYGISISPEAFTEHLRSVLRRARPVFLSSLVEDLDDGAVRPGTAVVTFDDAYGRTMELVEPLLRELGVPGTVFVPTGLLGEEPWWDRLAGALGPPKRLPEALEVPLGDGKWFRRRLGVEERQVPGKARDGLVVEVYDVVRTLAEPARYRALEALEAWTGTPRTGPEQRIVTADELAALARSDVLEFGSHSVTHPFLPKLAQQAQQAEVADSRRELESLLGRRIDLFSYPNGARDEGTRELVREAGYRGACASQPGVVTGVSDPFALPRFWPREDAREVERVARVWLGAA